MSISQQTTSIQGEQRKRSDSGAWCNADKPHLLTEMWELGERHCIHAANERFIGCLLATRKDTGCTVSTDGIILNDYRLRTRTATSSHSAPPLCHHQAFSTTALSGIQHHLSCQASRPSILLKKERVCVQFRVSMLPRPIDPSIDRRCEQSRESRSYFLIPLAPSKTRRRNDLQD